MKIHGNDIRVGNVEERHWPGSEDHRRFKQGGSEDDSGESDNGACPDRSTRAGATKREDPDHNRGYRNEESDALLIGKHREGVEYARQRRGRDIAGR